VEILGVLKNILKNDRTFVLNSSAVIAMISEGIWPLQSF
jgi:hypothetical protein